MATDFDRKRRFYRRLRNQVGRLKFLHRNFWRINRRFVESPLLSAGWKACFERNRLKLPTVTVAELGLNEIDDIVVPGIREDEHNEHAYLQDLIFLLQLCRAQKPNRILEVGTYRAKTTYAFHLNAPAAFIRSYDVREVASRYRTMLQTAPLVELRLGSFAEDSEALRREKSFDLIFIDGSHRLEDVLEDSAIAFDIVDKGGAIVWHDYRQSGAWSPDLQVPEALHHLQAQFPISAVKHTNCAIHLRK